MLVAGLERVVVELANGMLPQWQVTVCCYDQVGPMADLLQDPARAVLLPRGSGFDRAYPKRLAALMAELEVDLVHAHNRTAFVYAALATRHHAVPLVYTEHGPTQASSWKARWLMRLLARRRDRHFVAVAEWIHDLMVRSWGMPRRRTSVIPNGVSAAGMAPPQLRRELAVEEDAPLIGIVAGLNPVKDHGVLLEAMVAVRARIPRARLAVIGDGPERARLEQRSSQLGLRDVVHFVGVRPDARRELGDLSVVVLCSRSEGMSITLLEAMAAGRPIVATAVGGTPELVTNGRTGLLVPAGDAAGLAEALCAVLEDPSRAEALGREARAEFDRRFAADRMIEAYRDLYASVLAR